MITLSNTNPSASRSLCPTQIHLPRDHFVQHKSIVTLDTVTLGKEMAATNFCTVDYSHCLSSRHTMLSFWLSEPWCTSGHALHSRQSYQDLRFAWLSSVIVAKWIYSKCSCSPNQTWSHDHLLISLCTELPLLSKVCAAHDTCHVPEMITFSSHCALSYCYSVRSVLRMILAMYQTWSPSHPIVHWVTATQ
jgi:hypothetical protein